MIEPFVVEQPKSIFTRWQKLAAAIAFLVLIGVNFAILNLGGQANDTLNATRAESKRRDCVTTLSAARRNVFDDVDIYKAKAIQMLSDALLSQQRGTTVTKEDVAAYDANNVKLTAALVLAANLPTLDYLIAHGGTIQGSVYPKC